MEHQRIAVEYGLKHNKWLLADEQGLGKSKVAIDIAVKLNKRCLIVCCVNTLKKNWEKEIRKHSNKTSSIYPQTDGFFIIVNIEKLRNEETAVQLSKLCRDWIVVVDEIHKVKSPRSKQGQGLLSLQPEYKLALTGTPVTDSPLDLYVTLKWLDCEPRCYSQFRSRYCIIGGYNEIIGYKHLDELKSRLQRIMLRRLKRDVLELPDKTYINWYVEGHEQGRTITELRQSTAAVKLEELKKIAYNSIVFASYVKTAEAIHSQIGGYLITGNTKDRQKYIDAFQCDNKNIVGTYGALGHGVTLTAADSVIFIEEPWNISDKKQAEDRAHRIGQVKPLKIYTLMVKDSIDEYIHNLLENKGKVTEKLLQDYANG